MRRFSDLVAIAPAPDRTELERCSVPRGESDLCTCVTETPSRAPSDMPAEPWHDCYLRHEHAYPLLHLESPSQHEVYLVEENTRGWRLVAFVGGDYDVGPEDEYVFDYTIDRHDTATHEIVEVSASYLPAVPTGSRRASAEQPSTETWLEHRGPHRRDQTTTICARKRSELTQSVCAALPTASSDADAAVFSVSIDLAGVLEIEHVGGSLEGELASIPGRYRLE